MNEMSVGRCLRGKKMDSAMNSDLEKKRMDIIDSFKRNDEELYKTILDLINTPNTDTQFKLEVYYSGTGESYGK